jgi:transcription termination factor Rho
MTGPATQHIQLLRAPKQDLIFRIEQALLETDTVIRGEGVLEILPEVRLPPEPDWNYLYGPDDIYVGPSQIKRFDLRTGDTVKGQVRLPRKASAISRCSRSSRSTSKSPRRPSTGSPSTT